MTQPGKVISAVEHDTITLEFDDLFEGSALRLFEHASKLVQISFKKGVPCVQLGRYLGYLPLNEKIAIQVGTRVSIRNLERIISMADANEPIVLAEHDRLYAASTDHLTFLTSSIAEQFLASVERILHEGPWLEYRQELRIGAFPTGRIRPFESTWRSELTGTPVAVTAAFHRGLDSEANGLILAALRKVRVAITGSGANVPMSSSALPRLARCEGAFAGANIQRAWHGALQADAIVERIPESRSYYRQAVRLGTLLLLNAGISLRDRNGLIELDTILIDMEKVFESYARQLLIRKIRSNQLNVLDGNKGQPVGARKQLFGSVPAGSKNPDTTPDIVIKRADNVQLIIDAKYKPLDDLPAQSERSQILVYGVSYGCPTVALLYPDRGTHQPIVTSMGAIGDFELLVLRINLDAADIENEETEFANAALALVAEN